jgi:AcrR family transcriptional regulator
MDTRSQIISSAEHTFDHHGFTATGMDRLTEAAGVSSRTLYKHVGSKTALITAVLEERGRRFFSQFNVHSVDALFAALESWTRIRGARGCLFLRALGETGGEISEVSDAVATYRRNLRDLIDSVVANDTHQGESDVLAGQILVLFEGAIAAASYRGLDAIRAARTAAAILVEYATSNPKRRDRNRSPRN